MNISSQSLDSIASSSVIVNQPLASGRRTTQIEFLKHSATRRRETLISSPYYKTHKAEIQLKLKSQAQNTGRTSILEPYFSDLQSSSLKKRGFFGKKKAKSIMFQNRREEKDLNEPFIRLISSGGKEEFKIDMVSVEQNEALACKVAQFAHVKPEKGISFAYQVRRVPGKLLKDVIEYSVKNQNVPLIQYYEDESNPLNGVSDEKLGFLPPTDWEFVKGKRRKRKYLIRLLQSATDLNNKGIILMVTNMLAMRMSSMNVNQLRKFMGVTCDFTKKDWKRLAYEKRYLIATDSDSEPEYDVSMMYNDLIVNNVYDQVDILDLEEDQRSVTASSTSTRS